MKMKPSLLLLFLLTLSSLEAMDFTSKQRTSPEAASRAGESGRGRDIENPYPSEGQEESQLNSDETTVVEEDPSRKEAFSKVILQIKTESAKKETLALSEHYRALRDDPENRLLADRYNKAAGSAALAAIDFQDAANTHIPNKKAALTRVGNFKLQSATAHADGNTQMADYYHQAAARALVAAIYFQNAAKLGISEDEEKALTLTGNLKLQSAIAISDGNSELAETYNLAAASAALAAINFQDAANTNIPNEKKEFYQLGKFHFQSADILENRDLQVAPLDEQQRASLPDEVKTDTPEEENPGTQPHDFDPQNPNRSASAPLETADSHDQANSTTTDAAVALGTTAK